MTSEVIGGGNGTQIQFKGLGKTLRAIERAGAKSEDLRALMYQIGSTVASAARPPRVSGALAATIRPGRGKTKAVIRAGGARVPYAGVQHYGWPARGIKPTLFLTDAIARTQSQVLTQLDTGITNLLKETNNG